VRPPTAELLELPLLGGERLVFASAHDGQVGLDVGIADRTDEGEAGVEPPLVQVIEKQAADTPGFVSMLEVEIAVAPGLVARIHLRAERRTGLLGHAVPMHAVFGDAVVRRQVEAATEPPDRLFAFLFRDEKAHVGVGGRNVGVVRMDHQRHAQGFEATPGQFRPMGAGRRWETAAEDVGKVNAALFNDRTVLQHPGATATAGRPGPGVFDEASAAVLGFQCSADAVLQVEQIGFHGLGASGHDTPFDQDWATRRTAGRWPMGAQDTTALAHATVDEGQA
jgi:hypothetical protein